MTDVIAADNTYLSIIIPARNEANRMTRTLVELDAYLERVPFSYEIIISESDSTDETRAIAERLARLISHLRVVVPDSDSKKGKGAAIARGMQAARGQYRLCVEADHAVSIEHFMQEMFPLLRRSAPDIIVSSKVSCTCGDTQNPVMRFLEKITHAWIRRVSLPEYAHCGFICFSARASRNIFPLQKIDGWGFDIETLLLANRLGYAIVEVRVTCKNRRRRKFSVLNLAQMVIDMVRIRRFVRNNDYKLDKEWEQGKFIF